MKDSINYLELFFPFSPCTNPAMNVQLFGASVHHLSASRIGACFPCGDPAFIHDPSLTTSEWQNSILPAVVLSVAWNKSKRMYKFNAAVLSRWDEGEHPTETPCLPIRPVRDESPSSVGSVHARWPWSDTFCYVFKRRILFHCLPSQVCILLH